MNNFAQRALFESADRLHLLREKEALSTNTLPGVSIAGAGYWVFDGYASSDSTSYQVFDWANAPKKTVTVGGTDYEVPQVLEVGLGEKASYSMTSGDSIQSFQLDLNSHTKIDGSYNFFSGSLDVDFSMDSLTWSENEFSRVQQTIHLFSLLLDPLHPGLRGCLKAEFRNVLDAVSTEAEALAFMDNYGSHFLTGIIMGGSARLASATNKVLRDRTYDLEVTAQASYKTMTGQISGSEYARMKDAIDSFNAESNSSNLVRGGKAELAAKAFQGEEGFDAWSDSVRDNPDFVDFRVENALTGFWVLCKDSASRDLLQRAFSKWAAGRSAQCQRYADYVDALVVISGNNSDIAPPSGYTRIDFDLNRGAGGDFVYLCYHKASYVPNGVSPQGITDLEVIYGQNTAPPDGYNKLPTDLNQGAGGDYVYLCYQMKPYSNDEMIKDVSIIGGTDPNVSAAYLFTRLNNDLNRGAKGDFIYLTYSRKA